MNFHSGAKVFSMNAAYIAATYQHHQNRLRLGVCGVVLEVKIHAKLTASNFCGQWYCSQVALAGTSRLASIAD
jgi:hypothetical protein